MYWFSYIIHYQIQHFINCFWGQHSFLVAHCVNSAIFCKFLLSCILNFVLLAALLGLTWRGEQRPVMERWCSKEQSRWSWKPHTLKPSFHAPKKTWWTLSGASYSWIMSLFQKEIFLCLQIISFLISLYFLFYSSEWTLVYISWWASPGTFTTHYEDTAM